MTRAALSAAEIEEIMQAEGLELVSFPEVGSVGFGITCQAAPAGPSMVDGLVSTRTTQGGHNTKPSLDSLGAPKSANMDERLG